VVVNIYHPEKRRGKQIIL